ncbi:MAG: glutamate ligase domain-containing protein, partial [Bacillus sp. (in: firmicutes)]
LELGPEEEQYHQQIGEALNDEKVDLLFTYGKLGRHIADKARTVLGEERVFAFTEKDALIQELKRHVNNHTLILVKASRGMKLEEIVIALQVN